MPEERTPITELVGEKLIDLANLGFAASAIGMALSAQPRWLLVVIAGAVAFFLYVIGAVVVRLGRKEKYNR